MPYRPYGILLPGESESQVVPVHTHDPVAIPADLVHSGVAADQLWAISGAAGFIQSGNFAQAGVLTGSGSGWRLGGDGSIAFRGRLTFFSGNAAETASGFIRVDTVTPHYLLISGPSISGFPASPQLKIGAGIVALETGQLIVPPGTLSAPGIAFFGDTNSGVRLLADNDWALVRNGVDRIRITDTLNFYSAGGAERMQYDNNNNKWRMGNGSTGMVEIFPKGTLITMATAIDVTDQTTTTGEVIYDTQTVGVDFANQLVYVDVTISVLWKSMAAGESVFCAPAVMGSRRGDLAWHALPGTTGASAPGTSSNAAGSSASNTGATQPDVSGNSGGASAGTAHTHTAGTYTTTPGGGHQHLMTHTHSHSHTVDSHTHAGSAPGYRTVTIRWIGQVNANGSGQVTIGISAGSTSAGGVFETSTIAYAIWRA